MKYEKGGGSKKGGKKNKIPVQDRKRMAMQTTILRVTYAAGILAAATLAPKLVRILPLPDGGKKSRAALYKRMSSAKASLKQGGYLTEDATGRLRLTERGERRIEKILLREYRVPEPVRWDGRWRVLCFDVAEKRRKTRHRLRSLLQGAGFARLQDSVWVYPYPCDEFVQILRAHLKSGVGELRQLTADALESDRALREHFRLE